MVFSQWLNTHRISKGLAKALIRLTSIWGFAGRTYHIVGNPMSRLIWSKSFFTPITGESMYVKAYLRLCCSPMWCMYQILMCRLNNIYIFWFTWIYKYLFWPSSGHTRHCWTQFSILKQFAFWVFLVYVNFLHYVNLACFHHLLFVFKMNYF